MPYIVLKIISGRSESLKQEPAARLTQTVVGVLGAGEASNSVAIEDVAQADWTARVYVPNIQEKTAQIYKKPGYDPFAQRGHRRTLQDAIWVRSPSISPAMRLSSSRRANHAPAAQVTCIASEKRPPKPTISFLPSRG
jgi:4-oxalocrotonate tautomerase